MRRTAVLLPALLLLASLLGPTSAHAASKYFSFNHGPVPPLYQRSYGTASDPVPARRARSPRCERSLSLLALFPRSELDCSEGVTFPGLIRGDCPIALCVLKTAERGNGPFGSMKF